MTPDQPLASPSLPRRIVRWLVYLVATLVVVAVVLAIVLRVRYGGGEYYPDLTSAATLADDAIEIAATSDEPIGNLAVSADGRLFYSIHPESRPTGHKMLEWVDGEAVPFPSEAAQDSLYQTVLGVAIDRQNRLWTIDHGEHGSGDARLVAVDIATREVVHDHVFSPDVAQLGSFLQDLQIDAKGETVYIADVSFWRRNPGIVVYDIASKTARRVLDSHPSVFPQDWIIRNPIKEMVFFGGVVALKAGVDGIAVSRDDQWVYYAAMNHDTLFRIATRDLRDPSLSEAELARRVEAVGLKPLNDGLSTDVAGNVLVTDVEHGAVVRMSPKGEMETLVKSAKIRWADALSYGPDGWLYLADSAIPEQMLRSRANIREKAPYFIYRFRPGIAGVPGQ